jgi:hypothetical protein
MKKFKSIMECFGVTIYDIKLWDQGSIYKEGQALAMFDRSGEWFALDRDGVKEEFDIGVHYVIQNLADKCRVVLEWQNESILGVFPE